MTILVPLLAASLASSPANPWLEKAKAAYARLDCDEVLADLAFARQVPTNDAPTQLAIFDFAGRCHVALGHKADADLAFAQMLELDPQAELDPALSPKIREAFGATKLRLYPAGYVGFKELTASAGLRRAELVDPWKRVEVVVLGLWDEPQQKFQVAPLVPSGGVYVAQVGEAAWFLEARTANGAAVALLGRKQAPAPAAAVSAKGEAPAAPTDPARTRHTLAWVGIGTGAAAAATGIVLWAVSGGSRSSAEQAAWADDAVALDRRGDVERSVGHGLFWPGLLVAGVGIALSW